MSLWVPTTIEVGDEQHHPILVIGHSLQRFQMVATQEDWLFEAVHVARHAAQRPGPHLAARVPAELTNRGPDQRLSVSDWITHALRIVDRQEPLVQPTR